jgi:hypothetical protein
VITALILAQCFVVDDGAPGWNELALPPEAPQLVAVGVSDQFRAGEPALVTHDLAQVLRRAYKAGVGKFVVEVALPTGARSVTARFARPLHGAKVDAVLEGSRGRMAVLDEKRQPTAEVNVRVSLPDADRLVLTVHHHLRAEPSLESLDVEQLMVPALAGAKSPPGARALFVYNPGGPLTLCNRPGEMMTVTARRLSDERVTRPLLRPLPP